MKKSSFRANAKAFFIVNQFARDYSQNILHNHVDGRSIGMAYFRNRGFRDDIIEKFQLGYCTESHIIHLFPVLQNHYLTSRIGSFPYAFPGNRINPCQKAGITTLPPLAMVSSMIFARSSV